MFDPLETKGNIQQPEIISSVDLLDMNYDTKVHTIDYLKPPIAAEMEELLSIPPFDLHSSTNNSGSPYSCKFICGNGSWSEFLLRGVEFMGILPIRKMSR
jgi:hypothetical protein